MTLKLIGAATIIIVCGAVGVFKTGGLSRRVRQLEAFIAAVDYISTEIRYCAAPAEVLMSRLASLKEYSSLRVFAACTEKLASAVSFREAWASAIAEAKDSLDLDYDDREVLLRFGSVLGTTDIEGQTANCEHCRELLIQRLSGAVEDRRRHGRMYTSLGVLCGVFIATVLI
jgi:stage III sporulation protein AB